MSIRSIFSKKQIPNHITAGRIVLFFLNLLAIHYTARTHEGWHTFLCILAAIVYLLDWVDGYVARKYNWQSRLGAILDPAGDKVVAYGMLAYLWSVGLFPIWALMIILFRDTILSLMRLASLKHNFNFKTSEMGKLRTMVIGWGGAFIYIFNYWGNSFKVVYNVGVIQAILIAILLIFVINLLAPRKFLMERYPGFIQKAGVIITFSIAVTYIPYSIVLCMVWITFYTLGDYAGAFKRETDKHKDEPHIRRFLTTTVTYSIIGVLVTAIVISLLKVGVIYSILASTSTFVILVVEKFTMLQKLKPKRIPRPRFRKKREPKTQAQTTSKLS